MVSYTNRDTLHTIRYMYHGLEYRDASVNRPTPNPLTVYNYKTAAKCELDILHNYQNGTVFFALRTIRE